MVCYRQPLKSDYATIELTDRKPKNPSSPTTRYIFDDTKHFLNNICQERNFA